MKFLPSQCCSVVEHRPMNREFIRFSVRAQAQVIGTQEAEEETYLYVVLLVARHTTYHLNGSLSSMSLSICPFCFPPFSLSQINKNVFFFLFKKKV